jgi:hypothetical protein
MGKRKEDAMETLAHLFLIIGYGLLILKHFVGPVRAQEC